MIKCTILIHTALCCLISGNTHTFVANIFIDRIGMSEKDLGYDLVLSTLAGAVLTTKVRVTVTVLIQ